MNHSAARRAVIGKLAMAFGVAAVLPGRRSNSAELPRLDVKDPAAVALGYVEEASQVDVTKYPAFTAGSQCDNCLQLQGKSGESYRPCTLFPGKSVHASGWCASWTAEM